MKGGSLLYKCRLCGKVQEKVHVPNAMVDFCRVLSLPDGAGLLLNSHSCNEKTQGVMDLVGVREDE